MPQAGVVTRAAEHVLRVSFAGAASVSYSVPVSFGVS